MIAESEFLISAATPDIYRVNAFRISGLTIDATNRDIIRQIDKIELMKKYGGKNGNGTGALPLDPHPDSDTVHEAILKLRDPERRIVDELFWFWPYQFGKTQQDEALRALFDNNIEAASEEWKRNKADQSKTHVSLHNLAVLAHLIALDLEYKRTLVPLSEKEIKTRDQCWLNAIKLWRMISEDESFWSKLKFRIRQIDDPRLTSGTARRIQESLPLTLLLINARLSIKSAEVGDKKEADRQLNIMNNSGFDKSVIDEALYRAVEPITKRIKALCKSSSDNEEHPKKNNRVAKQLLTQAKPLLAILDIVLPPEHPTLEGAHDEVALTAFSKVISFGNATKEWQKSIQLLDEPFKIAKSDSAKSRINQNIDILKSNHEYYLENEMCFFCKSNPGVDSAGFKVKMYGNVKRTRDLWGLHERITWNHATITVPRCSECKVAHSRFDTYRTVGGVLGGLAGLTSCVAITSSSGAWFGGLLVMGILIVIGISTGFFIWKSRAPFGIKPESKKHEFIRIKELLNDGWNFGEKPPEAYQ